jgi:hypothetical protein
MLGTLMSQSTDSAKYWRGRAANARAMMAEMRDPETKRILQDIADSYDRIADITEAREKGNT